MVNFCRNFLYLYRDSKKHYMKRSVFALDSEYIIDGVQMDSTPAQLLDDCMSAEDRHADAREAAGDRIVDEIVDPEPASAKYDPAKIPEYVEKVISLSSRIREGKCMYPESYTRRTIAEALISTLWRKGHFSLEDMEVELSWSWDTSPLGNMAAFYRSAEAAAQYLFDLSVRLRKYEFADSEGETRLDISATADGKPAADKADDEYDFLETENDLRDSVRKYCWISDDAKCDSVMRADTSDDWLIYVPFDTCDFRLGGSAFEKIAGTSGDPAPEIQDPDYFMDCFEIVRELVEDGIVVAGRTVGSGGLAAAAASMCEECGVSMDVSGIGAAYSGRDPIRILFSEVPGVLIQIRDCDYDYVDSQMLLQDLAYYPLGHPDAGTGGLRVTWGRKSGVSDILASLIQGQASEGED